MTRQRRWQIKQAAQGCCMICGKSIFKNKRCQYHYWIRRVFNRNSVRKKLGIPLEAPLRSYRAGKLTKKFSQTKGATK